MSMETLVQSALDMVSAHPYTTGAILAGIGVLAWFRTKLVMKAIAAGLILIAIAYVVMFLFSLTSTGVENTQKFRGSPEDVVDKIHQ